MAHQSSEPVDDESPGSGRRTFLKSLALAAPLGGPIGRAATRPTNPPPPGYGDDHVDAARALAQHERSVTDSSSARTNFSYMVTANGGASVRIVEAWTDYRRPAQLVNAKAVYSTGQRYVADGEVYTKISSSYDETPDYDRTRGDILVNRSTGTDVLEKFLPALDFQLDDTATRDGLHRYAYEATDFDAESFTIYLREPKTVRSYDASLTVDERGRIHHFPFTLDATGDDGNPLTVEASVELDGFDRTTVRQPEWVRTEFQ